MSDALNLLSRLLHCADADVWIWVQQTAQSGNVLSAQSQIFTAVNGNERWDVRIRVNRFLAHDIAVE